MMETNHDVARLSFGAGAPVRPLAEEVAIALSFDGSTQAVMMASPADLMDFAYGFAHSEGIGAPEDILSIEVIEVQQGIELQIWLRDAAEARLTQRRRTMAGPVGCGLCGIDSLQQAVRPPAQITDNTFTMTPAQVMTAIATLPSAQPLHDATRAAHAAGFWNGNLVAVREDVGRHNALDKLIGHLIRSPVQIGPAQSGAVLLTSRVSIDMVQKVAALGTPILIAVSAPTAHAVRLADQAGITLIALAKPDKFQVFTHSQRIVQEHSDAQ